MVINVFLLLANLTNAGSENINPKTTSTHPKIVAVTVLKNNTVHGNSF
jgi:hypothetical protein